MIDANSPYYLPAINAAQQNGVPAGLFLAQLNAESGGNPTAFNASSGATGIAQFLPSTASNPGYGISSFDPTDPIASINAAAKYDGALFASTGNWSDALAKYSGAGVGNTPYANNQGVQAQLAGLNWGNLVPNWLGGSGGAMGGSLLDTLAPSGGSISIIDAVKRAGLFTLAVVLVGVGVWALAKGDVGELVDRSVKGLGKHL